MKRTIASLFALALTSATATAADVAACTDTNAHPKPSERVALCTEALKTPGLSVDTRIALLRGRGHAYYDDGKSNKAIADHTEILRLKPDDAQAYYDRGWVKTTVVVGTAATGKAAFDSVAAAVSIAK